MKLEFLPAGSPDCPLRRLYDFSPAEIEQLPAALTALVSGTLDPVAVHELPGVEPLNGCRLTLRVRPWDQAACHTGGPAQFECGFTAETWDNVAGLVVPFTRGAGGFQWLASVPGEVSWLLSDSGRW
jgi:hypothetical protein